MNLSCVWVFWETKRKNAPVLIPGAVPRTQACWAFRRLGCGHAAAELVGN